MSEIVKTEGSVELVTLAEQINAEHRACEAAAVSAVDHAIRAGQMLTEVKASLQHGAWLPWLEQNFEGSRQIADVYRKLAANKELINCQRVGNLSIRGALKELEYKGREAKEARRRVERRLKAEKISSERWKCSRWENYLPTLPNESISLLLTDPPYGMEYISGHRTIAHKAIENDGEGAALANLAEMLKAANPKLACDAHVIVFTAPRLEPAFRDVIENAGYTLRSYLMWVKNNTSMGDLTGTFAPKHERIIHAAKGEAKMVYRAPDVFSHPRVPTENHPTEKPVPLLKELIEATTVEGEAVLDPYGGVASTLVAAEDCGRRGYGCEIDADYFNYGLIRLSKIDEGGEAA